MRKEKKPPPPLHLSLPPHQMALVLAPICTVGNEYLRMSKESENEDLRKKISFSGKRFEKNNSRKEEKPPPPLHLSLPPHQMAG